MKKEIKKVKTQEEVLFGDVCQMCFTTKELIMVSKSLRICLLNLLKSMGKVGAFTSYNIVYALRTLFRKTRFGSQCVPN